MFASDFTDPAILPGQGEHAVQTTLLSMGYTRKGPRGAQRFTWKSATKSLESTWLYDERTMAWTLAPVSHAESTIYLTTLQDGEPIVIGPDWATGEQNTTITLPPTYRINTLGPASRSPEAATNTTLRPFQPEAMTLAQLAAVSYLARYTGQTHVLYAYQVRRWFTWCESNELDPLLGVRTPGKS